MFSGLVAGTGKIQQIQSLPDGLELKLDCGVLHKNRRPPILGDSIAVNGICLTVSSAEYRYAWFQLSVETLAITSAKKWSVGDEVNLESSLRVGDALGGHWVTGHIDAIGKVDKIIKRGANVLLEIEYPSAISSLLVAKGSIAVDGISLTINRVIKSTFSVCLIPTTLQRTSAKNYARGRRVNLETDILARYAQRAPHRNI